MTASPITVNTNTLINGQPWTAQSINKPYSIARDSGVYTFETRPGENYQDAGDTKRRQRAELCSNTKMASGNQLTGTFSFNIPSDTLYPREWFSFFQMHGNDSVNINGSAFQVGIVYDVNGNEVLIPSVSFIRAGNTNTEYASLGSIPFLRDHSYNCKVDYRDSFGGPNGFAIFTLYGTTNNVLTYTGPTGAPGTTGCYPKFGIHAGNEDDVNGLQGIYRLTVSSPTFYVSA